MTDDNDSSPLTRDIAPFGLRMPPELKARVKLSAENNGRSMNSEIVSVLEEAFPAPRLVPISILSLADYMNFVESAKTEEEREEFLRDANETLLTDEETAAFEIRLTTGPDGHQELYVGRRKTEGWP